MGVNIIAESRTVIMDTRDIDEYALSAPRENRDAINHSIIAKQREGRAEQPARIYLPNLPGVIRAHAKYARDAKYA